MSISVADSCFVVCPKTRLKVILEYLEEGWLGRAQNKVIGIIFRYDPTNDTKTKIKEVPESDIIGRIEGNWQDKVYYSLGITPFAKATEKIELIDLNPLFPVEKSVPPEEDQLPNESRRFWKGVTEAIVERKFGLATTLKQELEEKQRVKQREREGNGKEWQVCTAEASASAGLSQADSRPVVKAGEFSANFSCSHDFSRAPLHQWVNLI